MSVRRSFQSAFLVVWATASLTAICSRGAEPRDPKTQVIPIEAGWRYSFQDAPEVRGVTFDPKGWLPVRVPHNSHELGNEIPRSTRSVWLRTSFELPRPAAGGRVLLQVNKAFRVECWLNGQAAGGSVGDQSNLIIDVTAQAQAGRNVLAIQTRFPGIQGYVRVYLVPPVHLGPRQPMVDTPDWTGGPAKVRVRTEVENHSTTPRTLSLRATVRDPEGRVLTTASSAAHVIAPGAQEFLTLQSSPVVEPPLWSPETPRLCSVAVELLEDGKALDLRATTFGFRWYRFEPEGPFTLNGKKYPVRGVVYVKPAAEKFSDRKSLWEYEVGLLKGMGVNFIRSISNIDDTFLEVCDRSGFLLTTPVHAVNPENASEADIEGSVREAYNCPSLVAWHSNGEGKDVVGAHKISLITAQLRRADPLRAVICCELGWRAPGNVGPIDMDVAGQGNYTGWYEGTLDNIGPYLDNYRTLLRERYLKPLPILVSNYGAAADPAVRTYTPRRNDFSADYLTDFHQRFYSEIKQRPWLSGGFIFCYRDIDSEQPIPRHTWKGILDRQDQKKDCYFFYQSRWTTEPMVHLTQKDWTTRDLWPADVSHEVEVFSNCDQVELFYNGKSLGARSEENDHFVWNVSLREGANTLRVVARKAGAQIEDLSEVKVRFRPPAVELKLFGEADKGKPREGRLTWEPIPGVDQYEVFAGTQADFDAKKGRLVATVTGNSAPLGDQVGLPFYKVVASARGVAGPPSRAVSHRPGGLRWRFLNTGWLLSSPVLTDLMGDKKTEIVIGSYNGCVYALDAEGRQLWSFDAKDPVIASPAVAVLAPGEAPSVVVNSAKALFVLSNRGELKWRAEGIRQFDRSVRSPTVADLDGDGKLEIIVGSDTGKVVAFESDGKVRWEFSTAGQGTAGLSPTMCFVVDARGGKGKAVGFAADSGLLYLLDQQGKELWRRDMGTGESAIGLPPNDLTPAAGRLQEAGPVAIVAGGAFFKAFDLTGKVVWERKDLKGFPQISNLFRDGNHQVVLASGRVLRVLDHNGQDIWNYQLPHPRDYFIQPPTSGDLDADGEPDLVMGTRATHLLAISSRGKLMWTFDGEDEITGSPAVADLDGDGIMDVIFGCRDGAVYVVSGGQVPPDPEDARTYRGGNVRTAAYLPKEAANVGPLKSAAIAKFIEDVPYGSDYLQKMDIHLPKSDHPTPVLIELHGGGWRRGDKRQGTIYFGLLEKCVESGIAVITANYRLTPQSIWPVQAEDATRVVQFVRANAAQWNIDPARIALVGGSAGAHLSLWVGLHADLAVDDSPDPIRRQSTRVSAIVDGWAPTDLMRMELVGRAREAGPQLFGITPEDWDSPRVQEQVRDASPIRLVSSDDPPVLIMHTVLPNAPTALPADSNWKANNPHSVLFGLLLKQKLEAASVRVEFITEAEGSKNPPWAERGVKFLQSVFNPAPAVH